MPKFNYDPERIYLPEEFYFFIHEDKEEGVTNMYLTPKIQWAEDKYMFDQTLWIAGFNAPVKKEDYVLYCRCYTEGFDFSESMEGTFETEESPEVARAKLIELGMSENKQFSAFMKGCMDD